jgi:hypothetical protein
LIYYYIIKNIGLSESDVSVDLQTLENKILTQEQLNILETLINEEIRKGTSVSWNLHTKEELSDPIANNIVNLRGAPKGVASDLSHLSM